VLLLLTLRVLLLLKLALENTSGVNPNTGVSKKLGWPAAGLVALLLLLLLLLPLLLLLWVSFPRALVGDRGVGTAAAGPLPLLLLLLPLPDDPVTLFPGYPGVRSSMTRDVLYTGEGWAPPPAAAWVLLRGRGAETNVPLPPAVPFPAAASAASTRRNKRVPCKQRIQCDWAASTQGQQLPANLLVVAADVAAGRLPLFLSVSVPLCRPHAASAQHTCMWAPERAAVSRSAVLPPAVCYSCQA
jgi:hypothetical protein